MKQIEEFYAFMREREAIRLRRESGAPGPWTEDPVLAQFKFTNVKREHDRTTRDLVKNFYNAPNGYRNGDGLTRMLVTNATLARYFGWSSTVIEIGWQQVAGGAMIDQIRRVVRRREADREKVFTGAYMIPNCGSVKPKVTVVIDIIMGVHEWAQDHWIDWTSWQALTECICEVRGMGSFMAKEVLLDCILVSGWRPTDWDTWTPVGPGGRRGAARVLDGELKKPGGVSESAALEIIRSLYDSRKNLWTDGPELDLTDIQFQLCEFDKYSRVAEGRRPKAFFKPSTQKLP